MLTEEIEVRMHARLINLAGKNHRCMARHGVHRCPYLTTGLIAFCPNHMRELPIGTRNKIERAVEDVLNHGIDSVYESRRMSEVRKANNYLKGLTE